MFDEIDFRKVIEDDLMKLKFILKMKIASLEDIKKEEENIINGIKKVMGSVKEMEMVLEKEIEKYKRFRSGWDRAYAKKKWDAIGNAVKEEIENFNQEYMKTKDIYDSCELLSKRLDELKDNLKKMNAKNQEGKEKELKMLEEFKKQKEKGFDSFQL